MDRIAPKCGRAPNGESRCEEDRSTSPDRLRSMVHRRGLSLKDQDRRLILDAAAEIEGGEDAYVAAVRKIRALEEELLSTKQILAIWQGR